MSSSALKRIFFLFLLGLFFSSLSEPAAANEINDKFQQANRYYQAGDFQNAKLQYEELLRTGAFHFSVEYNLGNSYYQQGEVGKAMKHWLRAWRLNPRDSDVRYNLSLVSSKIGEPLFFDNFFLRGCQFIFYFFNLNELSILLSLALWGLCLVWISSALKDEALLKAKNFVFLTIFVLIGIWWLARYYKEEIKVLAIVTVPKAEVRSGPGKQFGVGFTIPEGRRVYLLRQELNSEWREIGVPREGLKGWMKSEELALVGD